MELIVVPAYNESKRIGRVVRDLFQHGFNNVLVVDDGSSDNTIAEATEAGAKVVTHMINRGQGAALETGNEYARRFGYSVVVHFDGDGQLNVSDINGAIEKINSDCDIVLGSRFLDNRSQIPWTKKRVVLPLARLVNRFLTGVHLTDVHNGFRVLGEKALNLIDIVQDGMAHNSEIVAKMKKNNLKFCEHPVEIRYFEYGQGVKGGLKIIFDWIIKK